MFVIEGRAMKEPSSGTRNIPDVSVFIYMSFLEDTERVLPAPVVLRCVFRREVRESSPNPVMSVVVCRRDSLPRFGRDSVPPDTSNKDFPDFFRKFLSLVNHHHAVFFIPKFNRVIKVAKNKLTTIAKSGVMSAFTVVPLHGFCEPSGFCQGFGHNVEWLFHRIHHLLVRFSAQENFGVWELYPVAYGGGANAAGLARSEPRYHPNFELSATQ